MAEEHHPFRVGPLGATGDARGGVIYEQNLFAIRNAIFAIRNAIFAIRNAIFAIDIYKKKKVKI